MSERPHMTLSTVVLDAPNAHELADFYMRLLGWEVEREEPDWIKIIAPDGSMGLSFQTEEEYVRPTWPARPGDQRMMMHLDIRVDDLDASTRFALEVGAVLADHQPEEDVRVFFDPAGHPFCLWIPT